MTALMLLGVGLLAAQDGAAEATSVTLSAFEGHKQIDLGTVHNDAPLDYAFDIVNPRSEGGNSEKARSQEKGSARFARNRSQVERHRCEAADSSIRKSAPESNRGNQNEFPAPICCSSIVSSCGAVTTIDRIGNRIRCPSSALQTLVEFVFNSR